MPHFQWNATSLCGFREAIRAVFSTTDKIVRAGLEPVDHPTSSDQ